MIFPFKSTAAISGKCIIEDPDIPTTVGYLDDNKNFHTNKSDVLKANEKIKELKKIAEAEKRRTNLQMAIYQELSSLEDSLSFHSYHHSGNISHLAEKLSKSPGKLRKILNDYGEN